MSPALSLVLPVHNERESLPILQAEIAAIVQSHALAVEVIYVDDGSRDGSWDVIKDLAARDPRVRGLRFRRNFGKAAALQAGFREVDTRFLNAPRHADDVDERIREILFAPLDYAILART